jgi:hypothetical protein
VLLAVGVFALVPAWVDAAGIGFKNDTKQVLYIQGSFETPRGIQRGQVQTIKPGEIGWDSNLCKGNRIITVYDANNRPLLVQVIPFDGTNDQFFGVSIPMPAPKGPKVKLTPEKAPPMTGN